MFFSRKNTLKTGLAAAAAALVTFTAFQAGASHFRYTTLSWTRSQANPLEVTFNITEAWRTSGGLNFNATGMSSNINTLSLRTQIGGTFTDASGENYQIWNTVATRTFSSAGVFDLLATGCCRIGTLQNSNANDFYRIGATIDLTQATDTGSPVAQAPVIVSLPQTTSGNVATFQLPNGDPDGDARIFSVTPSGNVPGGSGLTTALPTAGGNTLSVSPTGLLSWDTSGTALGQKYAMQVQVAEGDSQSSIPVDFIIEIGNTTNNQAPTVNGQSLTLEVGDVLNTIVTGSDPDNGPTTPLTWNLDGITGPQTVLNASFNPLTQLLMWNTAGYALGTYTFFISNFDGAANGTGSVIVTLTEQTIAEPATLALFGLGLFGIAALRRRQRAAV